MRPSRIKTAPIVYLFLLPCLHLSKAGDFLRMLPEGFPLIFLSPPPFLLFRRDFSLRAPRRWPFIGRGHLKSMQLRLFLGQEGASSVFCGDAGFSTSRPMLFYPAFLRRGNDAGGAFSPSRDFLVFQHRPGILFPPLGRVIFFRPRGAAGGCAVPRPVSSSRPSCAAIWRGRAFWHSDGFPGSWRAVWLR